MALKGGYSQTPLGAGGAAASANRIQNATPTEGGTTTMTQDSNEATLVLSAGANLTAATVAIPADAVSRIGQNISIASLRGITTVSYSGGTVRNPYSNFNADDCVTYRKIAANTWIRLI